MTLERCPERESIFQSQGSQEDVCEVADEDAAWYTEQDVCRVFRHQKAS